VAKTLVGATVTEVVTQEESKGEYELYEFRGFSIEEPIATIPDYIKDQARGIVPQEDIKGGTDISPESNLFPSQNGVQVESDGMSKKV